MAATIRFLALLLIFPVSLGQVSPSSSARTTTPPTTAIQIQGCIETWIKENPFIVNRFSRDEMGLVCQKHIHWTEYVKTAPNIDKLLTPGQLYYWRRFKDCQGIQCLELLASSTYVRLNMTTPTTSIATTTPTTTRSTTFHVNTAPRRRRRRQDRNTKTASTTSTKTTSTAKHTTRQIVAKRNVGAYDLVTTPPSYFYSPPSASTVKPLERAVRKEYRAMTDQERAKYHAAVKTLKKTWTVDEKSPYDIYTIVHSANNSAHFGHSFLPWHREFLKEFELALREADPDVGLPYWDSSLDGALPNPADSILWSENFLGTANGRVFSGPFTDWTVFINGVFNGYLNRNVTEDSKNKFYKESDVQFALNRTKYKQFSYCLDQTFEGAHGMVHMGINGQMGNIPTAPSDPIFYMHHAFVDYLWEQFRQTRQTADQREHEYPTEKCQVNNEYYLPNTPMTTLGMLHDMIGMRNVDGLSSNYTDILYTYQPRPVCTSCRSTCVPSSPYLFCDNRSNKCVSKVKVGGNCKGYEDQDVCYNGKCINGRCVG